MSSPSRKAMRSLLRRTGESPLSIGVCEPNNDIGLRSRSWVEEEGEVFRKGNVLLGPDEMEGEYVGEDLRKEVSILLASQSTQFSSKLLSPSF